MLYVFGNSHVATFSGTPPCGNIGRKIKSEPQANTVHPFVIASYLGSIIAYNFQANHLPKLQERLIEYRASRSADTLMLNVGEVDCRVHLAKLTLEGRDQDALVKECVDRYFEAVMDLKRDGWKMLIIGVHPTTTADHNDDPNGEIAYGTCALRNGICVAWNAYIKEKCAANGVLFISIYDRLVDENNITKMKYFVDYCHLSHEWCYPMFVDELKRVGVWPITP